MEPSVCGYIQVMSLEALFFTVRGLYLKIPRVYKIMCLYFFAKFIKHNAVILGTKGSMITTKALGSLFKY